jgi:hypothetical protein
MAQTDEEIVAEYMTRFGVTRTKAWQRWLSSAGSTSATP